MWLVHQAANAWHLVWALFLNVTSSSSSLAQSSALSLLIFSGFDRILKKCRLLLRFPRIFKFLYTVHYTACTLTVHCTCIIALTCSSDYSCISWIPIFTLISTSLRLVALVQLFVVSKVFLSPASTNPTHLLALPLVSWQNVCICVGS